jgi:hypothetical protein
VTEKHYAQRPLLQRLFATPQLAQVVPRLQPELLHRVIQHAGLEDCGELVALTSPEQLVRVFDLDLWRGPKPGMDEQFDADRFGVWLEVLADAGARAAADKVAGMDVNLVTTGLAHHARVFDRAAVSSYTTTNGDEIPAARALDHQLVSEVGGYVLVARRTGSWEAIIDVLMTLESDHHEYFQQVMHGCRTLSHSGFERDGLHDLLAGGDQAVFDLAIDRERRREAAGFLSPAEARAFLQMSRQLQLGQSAEPPHNAIARAYFRAIGTNTAATEESQSGRPEPASDASSSHEDAAVAAIVDILVDAGVVAQPRALLQPSSEAPSRLAHLLAHMQLALDSEPAAYAMRTGELAFLANAIVAGCSVQARPFTTQEASDAAASICNLGLENWPRHWLPEAAAALPDAFLVEHDLIRVFQVGWTVLHDDVCMEAAGRLIEVLAGLRCADRAIQAELEGLRNEMTQYWRAGTPWRARDAMDVLTSLDMPAWAGLLGLIDECPVMHGAIAASQSVTTRAVHASAFEFIADNTQIASVRQFLKALPAILGG